MLLRNHLPSLQPVTVTVTVIVEVSDRDRDRVIAKKLSSCRGFWDWLFIFLQGALLKKIYHDRDHDHACSAKGWDIVTVALCKICSSGILL